MVEFYDSCHIATLHTVIKKKPRNEFVNGWNHVFNSLRESLKINALDNLSSSYNWLFQGWLLRAALHETHILDSKIILFKEEPPYQK